MGKYVVAILSFLLLNLLSLLIPSSSCPHCPHPTPSPPPPIPKHHPPPPKVSCPPPPVVLPPPSPPPISPPPTPKPHHPHPHPPAAATCPIDTTKLSTCVDLLGGLAHTGIGLGPIAEMACRPLLAKLADLEAALCLCTTMKLKNLNLEKVLPVTLELLMKCGKHLPSWFQCPAA